MKNQMIELLKTKLCRKDRNCEFCQYHSSNSCEIEGVADAIFADGWIKLPCELGCRVWVIAQPCGGCPNHNEALTMEAIEECRRCTRYEIGECDFDYELIPEFGEYVFATKEEAEKQLKEMMSE